ncbi:choline sulfate utilization transcriptional regulator [Paraburkholderia phytofirmans]|uniref:Transcriptional regulator, LysR family n=1 Tax=Paraburkholderia phytofirmans (strain DSM 17436 / LMG 22146 / PsJN) TaxID=398527 RepID=B2TCL4_PARPJ|nr:LysR family transcriptional regulator [Paraburkholderia phytofirmans]ACD19438.1 transcriptional regulator, LysR family [Paraburkholderia phytofirmans PsJN]
MSRQDRLPPMQALTMFESAARLASFTAAARELGSTQPAVSQRVVQLEEALGAPLFERGHRGVTLTEDGERLFEAVRHALDTIRLATSEIRARRTPQTLTLSTDFGFATYWLMPRLSQFKALMPDVDVKIITSQSVFDPSHDQADIAIAFGDEHADWTARGVVKLFPERVTPVCSPAFLAAHPSLRAPADLMNLPLLHLEPTQPARWLSWADWFAAHELDAPAAHRGITFNSFTLVAHAAIMGQGVALGWAPLVDELLATGQLIELFEPPVITERGYLLVTQRTATPVVSAFRHWLLGECGLDAE